MTKRLKEHQIVQILEEAKMDVLSIDDLCRKHSISRSTFYKWKEQYGGLNVSDVKRLKQLEAENRKLKQMYAEVSLDNTILKDVIAKKL